MSAATDQPYQPTAEDLWQAEVMERAAEWERMMSELCLAPQGQQAHADNACRFVRLARFLRTGVP